MSDEDTPAGALASLLCGQASLLLALRGSKGRVIVITQMEEPEDHVGYIGATGYNSDDPNDIEAATAIVSDALAAICTLCDHLGIELMRLPDGGLGPRRAG